MSQSKRVRNKKEKRRISLETVVSNLEDSIKRTKVVIISSLKCLTSSGELCIDFVTKERLTRPPFPFVHALVVIYNRHLSFANGLYSEFDLELGNVSTRQERIKFLFKIFVCVAMITHVRVDIYVSPAKLLGGQEVTASHLFLRCLAKASKVSSEQSAQVAEEILKLGESMLYKQSVKTRNMIVRFQAIIRGWLTRMGWNGRSRNVKEEVTTCIISKGGKEKKDNQKEENIRKGRVEKFNSIEKTINLDIKKRGLSSAIVDNDCSAEEPGKSAPSLSEGKDKDKCTPIEEAVGSNKIEGGISNLVVEEERQYHAGSGDTNQRNIKQKIRQVDKEGKGLKKICHKPADSTYVMKHGSGTQNFEDKLEEKSKDEYRFKTKLIKKLVISNGVVTHQTKEVREVVEDRNEADTDTRLKVISEREVEINKRMERLKDREAKLKIRIEETKQKEMHLELYENRVKRLAEILRKQQDKMKEDEARRTIELDELRVQTISSSYRMPNITFKGKTSLPNEFHFSDELLRQACYNPTITDLRLGLERKERQLRTRYANLLRAEKDLQLRTKEFERNCASSREILEMQSASDCKLSKTENIMHTITREKNKRKVNKAVKENMPPDSSIPGDSNIPPDNTLNRRDAFVPATLPNELKARTSAPKTRKEGNDQSNMSNHAMTSKSTNSVPLLNVSDEKKNVQLSRRHSLPRSLIEYTKSHV